MLSAGMLAVSACGLQAQSNYSVTLPVPADKNNTMAYLLDFDTSEKVDSVVVTDNQVRFTGTVANPFIGRIYVDGARGPIFIVEEGDITFTPERAVSGTPLNVKMAQYNDQLSKIETEARSLNPKDSTQRAQLEQLYSQYESVMTNAYNDNKDNALGLYFFLQTASDMDAADFNAAVAANPALSKSKRVQAVTQAALAKAETSVGKHYKDFSVTYNGKTEKLSDYVKPGRYTLVDFWASWCGPCIRQTKVIKQLYNKYKDQGLDVVGVAVWDEPDNTVKAIGTHKLDWPCIINAQTIPTDLYGIRAIPCIILINPDGIIVSRDKQSDELIADVDNAMATYKASAQTEVAPATADKDTAAVDNSVIF